MLGPCMISEEIKSVYVRNLPPNVSESEIAEEFKRFGDLSSEGVVIRSRKVRLLALCLGCIGTSFFMNLTL